METNDRLFVFVAKIDETFVLKRKRHLESFEKLKIFFCFIFGPKWSLIVLIEVSLRECVDATNLAAKFSFVA